MKCSFTLNDLFLFAYSDKVENEEPQWFIKMQSKEKVWDELNDLLNSEYTDEEFTISPDRNVVRNIMSYSQALTIVKTQNAGTFNLLMN